MVGRESDRWGQEIVALIELHAGCGFSPGALHEQCTGRLARFKAPKEYIVVERVRRLGNGKADYRWAKAEAAQRAR